MRVPFCVIGGALVLMLGGAAPAFAAPAPLLVFAAASLRDALDAIDGFWAAAGHAPVRVSYASSGTLARQIEAGAPAAVFVSADEKWMDALGAMNLLVTGTRADLLGNALVLVEPKGTVRPVSLARGSDLGAILGHGGRLAVGDVRSVPAGIYAAQALKALGLWNGVADRLAPAADVRAALLEVENGAAPAGIVYRSDVRAAPTLAIAGTFPPASHVPITYPSAVLGTAADPAEARAYLAFLRSPSATAIFRADGFDAPPPAADAGP